MTTIAAAPWFSAPATKRVMAALEAARPGGARFVGGCVRNTLMGRGVDDIDIATQLTPEAVAAAARVADLAVHETGIEHGTLTLVAFHQPFEVTTLRRDVTTDGRRATVAFTEDWAEDAGRRDFTMNALYADGAGAVHDPTGQGLADLRAGRVAFIGEAETRIKEDFLRILRFFRFSAWYGRAGLDPVGLRACAALREGIDTLSAERVWKELKKLLDAPDPREVLLAMEASGVIEHVAPEADGLFRLHALIAIEADGFLAHDPLQRAAAMLRDDPHVGRAFAQRLKLSNEERDRLTAALDPHARVVSYLSMRELRRVLYQIGQEAFLDRAKLLWAADPNPRTASQWRSLLPLAETWVRPRFPLTGQQVMAAGVSPGPKVGAVMREVESWWIDADFPDDPMALAERLKAVAQALG